MASHANSVSELRSRSRQTTLACGGTSALHPSSPDRNRCRKAQVAAVRACRSPPTAAARSPEEPVLCTYTEAARLCAVKYQQRMSRQCRCGVTVQGAACQRDATTATTIAIPAIVAIIAS